MEGEEGSSDISALALLEPRVTRRLRGDTGSSDGDASGPASDGAILSDREELEDLSFLGGGFGFELSRTTQE